MKAKKYKIIGLIMTAIALMAFSSGVMAQESCEVVFHGTGGPVADSVSPCDYSNCSSDPDYCDSLLAKSSFGLVGNVYTGSFWNLRRDLKTKKVVIVLKGTGGNPNIDPYGTSAIGINDNGDPTTTTVQKNKGTVDGAGNWELEYTVYISPQPDKVEFTASIPGAAPVITTEFVAERCSNTDFLIEHDIDLTDINSPPDFGPLGIDRLLKITNNTGLVIDLEFNSDSVTQVIGLLDGESAYYEGTNAMDCYSVSETGAKGNKNPEHACEGTHGGEIPTLSEWGLIIFSLLLLSLMTIAVVRGKTTLAGAGEASISIKAPLFVPANYIKALTACLGLAVLGCIGAMMVYGTIAARDILGTLISTGIVAYIAHLWMNSGGDQK